MRNILSVALLLVSGSAVALDLSTTVDGSQAKAEINTTLTAGVGVRMQSASQNNISKGSINPTVCGVPYQTCQGNFRTQIFPAQHLVAAPGAAGNSTDEGDNDYSRYSIFQAPIKVTTDINATWRGIGVFSRMLFFYDGINDNFTEHFPNIITPQNYMSVGRVDSSYPGGRVYGPGAPEDIKRTDGEVLRESGRALQFLDAYIYGNVPVLGHDVSLKLGRQTLNWGESTTLVLNSINQVNPVNANNVTRIGGMTEEFFRPTNMISASVQLSDAFSLAAYYDLEWQPTEIEAPGTYFSTINLGTYNSGNYLTYGPGMFPSDPNCLGILIDNPLANFSPTCSTVPRLPDWNARSSGQYGFNLGYYDDSLGSGTQFNLYFEHYHSQIPTYSSFAVYPSCARKDGNSLGVDATDLISMLLTCPDAPIEQRSNPAAAKSSMLSFQTSRFVLEYPEDIDLIGASFNTTLGSYSLQGEVAYRPNKPFQIDPHDLAMASFGPGLLNCGASMHCAGSALGGFGVGPTGAQQYYGSSDFVTASGKNPYPDTVDVLEGAVPGAARALPNFVIPYRGGVVGQNAPCYPSDDPRFHPYSRANPCYIKGYERFQDFNFNFGATRVLGETENPFGAQQVTFVYEFGAEWIPGMPGLDALPLDGPGAGRYAATAGADGSGANGSRQACSTVQDCSFGPDGLRFNQHQQDLSSFPTSFSYGHRLIAILRYENVFPKVSLQPEFVFKQDIGGISPGPAGNFVKGRKEIDSLYEFRYQQSLSLNLGYTWYWGGGAWNDLSDRDFAQVYLKYQF